MIFLWLNFKMTATHHFEIHVTGHVVCSTLDIKTRFDFLNCIFRNSEILHLKCKFKMTAGSHLDFFKIAVLIHNCF